MSDGACPKPECGKLHFPWCAPYGGRQAGPGASAWGAFIVDNEGYAYDSFDDAAGEIPADVIVDVMVLRGTAWPLRWIGSPDELRLPGDYQLGDVASTVEAVLINDAYPDEGAQTRLSQAQAMAAGLNAAGGSQ